MADWHVFHSDDYFCGTGPLKLRVVRVLPLEQAPAGWRMVEGVEYDWRGQPVDSARRATVRITALRAAGVTVYPPPVKVVTWLGRVWRAEEHRDGWRLFQHGGQRLSRATLDQVVALLLAAGVDPEKDLDSV